MIKNCIAPNKLKTVNKDFRNFYKKETVDIKHKRIHEYQNDQIIQLFLKKMTEKLVENRAGIHINKIGYFLFRILNFPSGLEAYLLPKFILAVKFNFAKLCFSNPGLV